MSSGQIDMEKKRSMRKIAIVGVEGSGWVIAVFFVLSWVPVLQLISGLCSFVWLGCLPGTAGANKYGPDPLAASRLPAGRQTGLG